MSDAGQMKDGRVQIVPLGDAALLVRFADGLDDAANRKALGFARRLAAQCVSGVLEIVPSLVSVLVRYDFHKIDPTRLAGELALFASEDAAADNFAQHDIAVRFGGESGPDLDTVARSLDLSVEAFIDRHNIQPLRVLTTGFAPGFVYCGFHPEDLVLPRRSAVRPQVAAGSVLFAAGQTAIAATDIPTGWHVIGHTEFRNFDPSQDPPTRLAAGDLVRFEALR